MKKFISILMAFLLLISLSYAETLSESSGGSGGSPTGGVNCEKYYTCPDGSKVEYCEIVENFDESGNLIGGGCRCKSFAKSKCPISPSSDGGSGRGPGGISPISGGSKDKYEFIGKIGGDDLGSSNYKFNSPNDVAVDSSGNIYVIDSNNHRIMIYDSDFNFKSEFDIELKKPQLITIDNNDDIYIVDEALTDNEMNWGRVRKYSKDGNLKFALSDPFWPEELVEEQGTEGLINFFPAGITVNSKGNIYLSSYDNVDSKVYIFDSNGEYEDLFEDSKFNEIANIEFDSNDKLYINNYKNNEILVYDNNLNYERKLSDQGFQNIADIDFDSDGLLYVVDKFNQRVEVFDNNLEYFATIAGNGAGTEDNQLNFPHGIDIDNEGNVYITNHNSYRISIFQKNTGESDSKKGPGYTEFTCPDTCEQIGNSCSCKGPGKPIDYVCPEGCTQSENTCSCPGEGKPICPEECDWNGEVCSCKGPGKLICDGCKIDEKCYFKGTRLIINSKSSFCDVNNEWKSQKQDNVECQNSYECESNICEKNKCGKYCDGCSNEDGNCIPFGTRLENSKYCNIDSSINNQKSEESTCNNNYECTTNVCVDSKCISPNLIQKILTWFSKLFGG